MTFGEKIQRLRKEKGFSQEELAEKLSVTRQTVSKWELDQSTPDLEHIEKLCDIYEVTADYLIRQAQPENHEPTETPPEAAGTQDAERKQIVFVPTDSRRRYSSLFVLGIVLVCIGICGIFTFVILSALNPWGATVGKFYFEGLIAFLIGTNSLVWFILLCITEIAGIICTVTGIFKKRK